MAIISSSRRGTGISGIAALLLMVAALGLAGCGNDNPADSGGTMTVDIRGIKQQFGGGGFGTMATGVDDSPATTAVKSLVIGAVVITFSNTPLDETTQVDSSIETDLATDIINSINYFSIVDLPTSEDFVEFKVPPPGAGNWQVIAVGTRTQIATYTDLDSENVGIYYGFTPKFFNTSGDTGPDVPITMNRACFIDDPPKGCATYDEDGQAVVTTAVRILAVYKNGDTSQNHFNSGTPIDTGTGATTAAITALNNARTAASVASGDLLTVVQTHPLAADYNSACNSADPADYETDSCLGTAVTRF